MGKKKRQSARKQNSGVAALGMLPGLPKPDAVAGETLGVPGTFFNFTGEGAAANKEQTHVGTVQSFSALHKFIGSYIGAAMELSFEGMDQTTWVRYPMPFLTFWYKSHPQASAGAASPIVLSDSGEDDWELEEDGAAAPKRDKAAVHAFLSPVIRVDQVNGKSKGRAVVKKKAIHNCEVQVADGVLCGEEVSILEGVTSNAIAHMRSRAEKCIFHRGALETIEAKSGRRVEIGGANVPVYPFKVMFPHHCRFVKLVVDGMPQRFHRKETFSEYVQGFDARATLPHHVTIHRIAEVKLDLKERDRKMRIARHRKYWGGRRWYGLQIDLWVDDATGVCFAAISYTYTEVLPSALDLVKEPLEFEQFPHTRHTAENIKTWLLSVLRRWDLPTSECSGITPDGESAGVSALWYIEELRAYVDVCLLHQLQRSLLFSVGKAGATCQNKPACALIGKNNRIVQLSHQSRPVIDGLEEQQRMGGVPEGKRLRTVKTNSTRWGNIFKQLSINNTLQPCIDPVVGEFKRKNKGKAAIDEAVDEEADASELKTKEGLQSGAPLAARKLGRVKRREVMAEDMGLTASEWQDNTHLAAFLDAPFQTKEIIEKNDSLTGAQGIQLMKMLSNGCDEDLVVKELPANVTYKARQKRKTHDVYWTDMCDAVKLASTVLADELKERFFGTEEHEKPSVMRLVQLCISKQMPIESVLDATLVAESKGAYLRCLRSAATMQDAPKGSAPKANSSSSQSRKLFSPPTSTMHHCGNDGAADAEVDAVVREVEAWKELPASTITAHTDSATNMINEFSLMHAVKDKFPLHYTAFRQAAPHISHEADIESLFSLAKGLTHWNMAPGFLRVLTLLKGCTVYEPTIEEIWAAYKTKHGVHDGVDLCSGDESDDIDDSE